MPVSVDLDVTGLYFHTNVKNVEETDSIEKVCRLAMAQTSGSDQQFLFSTGAAGLSTIQIVHKKQATSRQLRATGGYQPNVYNPGVYVWDDEEFNFDRNPVLAWQYYVFRKGPDGVANVLVSGPQPGQSPEKRLIVPFSATAAEREFGKFHEGDRIVWRLVGIFLGPNVGSPKTRYPSKMVRGMLPSQA